MNEPPFVIEFANRSTTAFDRRRILQAAVAVLELECVNSAEISLAIVDSIQMQELNRRHLNHDYDTDVLSFLLDETFASEKPAESDPDSPERRGRGKIIEGEVIACAGMAEKTAAKFGWSPIDEMVLYMVHGLLHLVGYDDLSPAERRIMRSRERSVLHHLNLTPHYDEDSSDAPEDPDQPPGTIADSAHNEFAPQPVSQDNSPAQQSPRTSPVTKPETSK